MFIENLKSFQSPGQGLVLHAFKWTFVPIHFFPPCAGAGLVHVLNLFIIPPPQLLLHSSYSPKLLHLPSTMSYIDRWIWVLTFHLILVTDIIWLIHNVNKWEAIVLNINLNVIEALPGQGCLLHSRDLFVSPSHGSPPCSGLGFVQVLVLNCLPPPHDFVHASYLVQAVKPPSTAMINLKKKSSTEKRPDSAHAE